MGQGLKRESSKQQRGFDAYYGLGIGRSYAAIAKVLGVSLATEKLWGRSFRWQGRIRERDLEVARIVADRTLQEGKERRERDDVGI